MFCHNCRNSFTFNKDGLEPVEISLNAYRALKTKEHNKKKALELTKQDEAGNLAGPEIGNKPKKDKFWVKKRPPGSQKALPSEKRRIKMNEFAGTPSSIAGVRWFQ